MLRPLIGGKRLCDIIIPATYDSATSGINENSYLIDRNPLYKLQNLVTQTFLVNWSRNHDQVLESQLQAGYRAFDLRIADVEVFNDTFRWWHNLAGRIYEGLQQIHDFAVTHPEEILIVALSHYVAPGDCGTITKFIIERTRLLTS